MNERHPGRGAQLHNADASRQSLAHSAAGAALLAIEQAQTGVTPWPTAHAAIRQVATGAIDGGNHVGLYYGAPAVAFVLDCAAAADPRYRSAAANLDRHLIGLANRRLDSARIRMQLGSATTFAEYDLFYGLTGITALLLRRAPDSDILAALLRYLVTLTEPLTGDGVRLPGWWVDHDPDPTLPTPGGHANLGMAHGAAGILALLALAMRQRRIVEHHADAIDRLVAWFDRWRQHDDTSGVWWPQWLTRDELRTGRVRQPRPGLPSWCYGTPGIARALQLAAIATSSRARQTDAEQLLAACATDHHMAQLTGPGLCHGLAGLHQTLHRAAADARTTAITDRLPHLATAMTTHADRLAAVPGQHQDTLSDAQGGLLTGTTGAHLAAHTARHGTPHTGWDACLLIT